MTGIDAISCLAPCILCGKLTRGRWVFSPAMPQLFGAPPGADRHIIHPLCDDHLDNSDTTRQVGSKLLEAIMRVEKSPWN